MVRASSPSPEPRTASRDLELGTPHELFRGSFMLAPAENPNYDVSPDGERFLMIQPTETSPREIRVIVNWARELERLVPPRD